MMIIDTRTGTNIEEIAQGLFRVSTPLPPDVIPGGFTFNQFLLADEEPLLFHTGPRKFFPLTLTESVSTIWQPSEGMRQAFPYAPVRNASDILEGFARLEPQLLACMHGSSFLGEGRVLLRKLRDALAVDAAQPGAPADG
jgi:hypothetical protein